MNKIRNEKEAKPKHHRNTKDHKKHMRNKGIKKKKKLYEKLYANKMDNLEEMDKLLEMYNVLN